MLNGVNAGALGKGPARENAPRRAIQEKFVNLYKGACERVFGRRPGVTSPRRHFQRTESYRLPHLDFEGGDAPRNLIERGKNGHRV